MQKVPYFSKKKLIMAYKAGIKEGITSSKYFDNKEFVLEHIQEKYFDIFSVSNKLQNDRDVVLKWLDRFKKLPRHLPDICFKDPFIINFIIENKKHDSFNFVENLDFSFQTKENILKSFGKSKDILKPKNELNAKHPYQIPSNHPKNVSLFEKYHIASWDFNSMPWHKFKRSTTYDDIELKKEALKISPSAAFMFMLNGEISQKEYAQIFIEAFLDNGNIYEFNPAPFSELCYDSTPHDLKRILGFTQEEFDSLESSILEALFKKTNSINLLSKFREFFPCFNTISATKKIIENINFDRISDSQIAKLLNKNKYCEHSLNNPLHPLHFIKEQIGQNKIHAINSNNPELASHRIYKVSQNPGYDWYWWPGDSVYLDSDEVSKCYKNLDEKVKSSKFFLREFIPILHESSFYNDNVVKTVRDDIVKRTIEHIESKNDLNYLKEIIKYQSTGSFLYSLRYLAKKNLANKLFYFHISDKLQTPDIAKYFLIRNPYFLSNDDLSDRFGILNHLEIPFHKREHLSKVKNDKFFFELVSKKGIICFTDNLIPNHLLDNKEFMIHSIIKSYKALQFASDRIKSYPSVIKIAYLKNPNSFQYISTAQKKNKKFLKNIFNEPINIFLHAHHSIKLDKNIYLPALKADISLVSHFTAKKILKINLKLFNKSEREAIFDEFCQKMGTNDIWEIARYKKRLSLG